MYRLARVSLLALVLTTMACGSKGGGGYPAGADGGKKVVEDILKRSDRLAVIEQLKPTQADLAALFDASVVEGVKAHVDKLYAQLGGVQLRPEQTEILFHAATTEDLLAGNAAAEKFPGGYKRAAAKLKAGVTWYAWKFVEPGKSSGLAFDGLTYVNDHWVWVPKAYRGIPSDGAQ